MGMVKVPVETTLATELPEMVPKIAEAIMAILAGPPRLRPASAVERSRKMRSAPQTLRKAPNSRNRNTVLAEPPMGIPKIPCWLKMVLMTRVKL